MSFRHGVRGGTVNFYLRLIGTRRLIIPDAYATEPGQRATDEYTSCAGGCCHKEVAVGGGGEGVHEGDQKIVIGKTSSPISRGRDIWTNRRVVNPFFSFLPFFVFFLLLFFFFFTAGLRVRCTASVPVSRAPIGSGISVDRYR